MTLTTTGISSLSCQKQYAFSNDLSCEGIIEGFLISVTSGLATIQPGSAYIKVQDSDGTEFMAKVYLDTVTTISIGNNQDLVVKIPLANVQNGALNNDLTAVATIEVGATGSFSSYQFHFILGSTNGSGVYTPSISRYSGHYLPGCDFCVRCENGVMQLPNTNINGNLNIEGATTTQGDITVGAGHKFNGDGSGLTNIPTGGLAYATTTTPGVVRITTDAEAQTGVVTDEFLTPFQVKSYYDKNMKTMYLGGNGNTNYTGLFHNCGKIPKTIQVTGIRGSNGNVRSKGTWGLNGDASNGIMTNGNMGIFSSGGILVSSCWSDGSSTAIISNVTANNFDFSVTGTAGAISFEFIFFY